MSEYFITKSKFLAQQDSGLIKAVTELHLVDALSFTEAEARISTELAGCRDLVLMSCARSKIAEVVEYGDTNLFFKVKVTYTTQDEDSDKEKKITLELLVEAADTVEAESRTQDHLSEMLVPFQIPSIVETKIAGVLHHNPDKPRERPSAPEPSNLNEALEAKHNNEEE